jgi:hypothetical protein
MNEDEAEKRTSNNKGRLPVTMNVMLLLQKTIRTWERLMLEKLLVWAFEASFRIHCATLRKISTWTIHC